MDGSWTRSGLLIPVAAAIGAPQLENRNSQLSSAYRAHHSALMRGFKVLLHSLLGSVSWGGYWGYDYGSGGAISTWTGHLFFSLGGIVGPTGYLWLALDISSFGL